MADTKISAATLTTPASTDLIPLERPSSAVARYASIKSIVQAQPASLTETGAVELATTGEAQAGASAALAVTPAGLAAYFDQTIPLGTSAIMRYASTNRPEYFQSGVFDVLFTGVYDPVFYWGWNITDGTVRIDTAKGALWQQFEYDYFVGGDHVMEWNFNAVQDDQTGGRFMAFVVDKQDYTKAYWEFWIGNKGTSFFEIADIATNNPLLVVNSKPDIPTVQMTGTVASTGAELNAVQIAPTMTNVGHGDMAGLHLAASVTVGDGTNVGTIASLRISAPVITATGGSTIVYPTTLQIDGAPAIGYDPVAFYVGAGYSFFADRVFIGGSRADFPTAMLDIDSNIVRLRTAKTPSAANDTGVTGDICWDANFVYVCTGTNAWKRAAIAAWP